MYKQNPPFHPLYLIAVALHISILIYVGLIFFLSHTLEDWASSSQFNLDDFSILVPIFSVGGLMSATLAIFAPVIFKKLFPPSDESQNPFKSEISLFFDFKEITRTVMTLTIMRMAFAESIALYGFVLSFINKSPVWIIPFACVALLVQFSVGPLTKFLRSDPIISSSQK